MSKSRQKSTTGSKTTSKGSTTRRSSASSEGNELLFGKETYLWILGGFVLVLVGLALMSGGKMPDLNTWDDSIIYSFRRTVLAPIVILAGLGLEIYVIFRK